MHLKRTRYTDALISLKYVIYHQDVRSKEPERFLFLLLRLGGRWVGKSWLPDHIGPPISQRQCLSGRLTDSTLIVNTESGSAPLEASQVNSRSQSHDR